MPVGCLCCSNAENVEHPGGNPTRFLSILSVIVIFHTDCDEDDINGVKNSKRS